MSQPEFSNFVDKVETVVSSLTEVPFPEILGTYCLVSAFDVGVDVETCAQEIIGQNYSEAEVLHFW